MLTLASKKARPSGEWSADDYDVFDGDPWHGVRMMAAGALPISDSNAAHG
jgi:hypothetical protein